MHPQAGDAARSLGKDGLRMKSDDDASEVVAADDAADTVELRARSEDFRREDPHDVKTFEAAYIQKFMERMHAHGSRNQCMAEVRKAINPDETHFSLSLYTSMGRLGDMAPLRKDGLRMKVDDAAFIPLVPRGHPDVYPSNSGTLRAAKLDELLWREADQSWRAQAAHNFSQGHTVDVARSLGKHGLRMKADDAEEEPVRVDESGNTPTITTLRPIFVYAMETVVKGTRRVK